MAARGKARGSQALTDLARGGLDGLGRALLAASALRDAILDPVGRTVDELERLAAASDAESFAGRLRTAALDEDLIAVAMRRRIEGQRPPVSPGVKRTPRSPRESGSGPRRPPSSPSSGSSSR